ncbi:MAG: hypothetical protein ACTSX8_07975 [Alphaproteobacteria bacterium]
MNARESILVALSGGRLTLKALMRATGHPKRHLEAELGRLVADGEVLSESIFGRRNEVAYRWVEP